MVTVLLALRFVLELCLLSAAAVIGLALSDRIAVGIAVLVAAVGILWGALLAPRRRFDLPLPARVAIEVALFVAAAHKQGPGAGIDIQAGCSVRGGGSG